MDHYFEKKPTSVLKTYEVSGILRNKEFHFISASGIFSAKKLDFGTKVLADNMIVKEDDSVLDLGCGIGILGVVASTLTKGQIISTDVNERACKIAKLNAKKIKNMKVKCGDGYEKVEGMKFDVILLNPPQTAGKELCFKLITEAKNYLNPNGSLQIVARHNKGGKTLSLKMEEVFGNMETVERSGGYRVYVSRKS